MTTREILIKRYGLPDTPKVKNKVRIGQPLKERILRSLHRYKQFSEQPDGTVWCFECKAYHHRIKKPGNGQNVYHSLQHIRKYIVALAIRDGRDLHTCEICRNPIKGTAVFHHTKYEGATYYDLKIACTRCNTQKENQLLA